MVEYQAVYRVQGIKNKMWIHLRAQRQVLGFLYVPAQLFPFAYTVYYGPQYKCRKYSGAQQPEEGKIPGVVPGRLYFKGNGFAGYGIVVVQPGFNMQLITPGLQPFEVYFACIAGYAACIGNIVVQVIIEPEVAGRYRRLYTGMQVYKIAVAFLLYFLYLSVFLYLNNFLFVILILLLHVQIRE